MTPEFAYKKYVALKLHFSQPSYDYFKYMGAVRVSYNAYDNRRDKLLFNKACSKYNRRDYIALLLSNFLDDPEAWIGDIISDSGHEKYLAWKKDIQSLKYRFIEDINYIENYILEQDITFCDMFKKHNPYPRIVRICLQKEISIDTFLLINKVLNFIPKIDKHIDDKILWESLKLKCAKYEPFLIKDEKQIAKYKKIMKEKFCNSIDNRV